MHSAVALAATAGRDEPTTLAAAAKAASTPTKPAAAALAAALAAAALAAAAAALAIAAALVAAALPADAAGFAASTMCGCGRQLQRTDRFGADVCMQRRRHAGHVRRVLWSMHSAVALAAAVTTVAAAAAALAAAALAKPTAAATAAQLRHPGQLVAQHIGLSPSALASRTGALKLQGTVPCSVPPAVAAAAAVVPGHAAG